MKHLRGFNESNEIKPDYPHLKPKSDWDEYVKNVFNQYMTIWDEDCNPRRYYKFL